uniref:Putative myosin viia and rab n=1 Tax=Rhipicephalus pulchellus TaxID=72859 RepID=L7M1C2_RHIPC
MGRRLNLSHLSQEECERILAVIQRDLELRAREKERLGRLEEELQGHVRGSAHREVCKDGGKSCAHCSSTFNLLFNRKLVCRECGLFVCRDCATYDSRDRGWYCRLCEQQRSLRAQSCEWFYENVKVKFNHFGSTKVLLSLYGPKKTDKASDLGATEQEESDVQQHVESVIESLLGESLDSASVSRLYRHPLYEKTFTDHREKLLEGVSQFTRALLIALQGKQCEGDLTPTSTHARLKELIFNLTKEVDALPALQEERKPKTKDASACSDASGSEDGEDVVCDTYEELLVVAVINKAVEMAQRKYATDSSAGDLKNACEPDIIRTVKKDHIDVGCQSDIPLSDSGQEEEEFTEETESDEFFWSRVKEDPFKYIIEEKIEEEITEAYTESDDDRNRVLSDPEECTSSSRMQVPFTLDLSREHRVPFPEMGVDIVTPYALDSDEEELEDDIDGHEGSAKGSDDTPARIWTTCVQDWEDNWLFRQRKRSAALGAFRGGRYAAYYDPINMVIPNPSDDCGRVRLGSKDLDELSEMSEKLSVGSLELSSASDSEEDLGANDVFEKEPTKVATINGNGKAAAEPRKSVDAPTNWKYKSLVEDEKDNRGFPKPQLRASLQMMQDSKSSARPLTSTPKKDKKEHVSAAKIILKQLRIPAYSEPGARKQCKDPTLHFSLQPEAKTTLHCGKIAKFVCEVSTPKLLGVAWFRGKDQLVPNDHCRITRIRGKEYVLELYNVDKSDEGTYSAVAYTDKDEVWCDFALAVRATSRATNAPDFTVAPHIVELTGDSWVQISCTVSGYPEPRVWFLRDDLPLPDSEEERFCVENKGYGEWCLRMQSPTPEDEAKYIAVAGNSVGRAQSSITFRLSDLKVKPASKRPAKASGSHVNNHQPSKSTVEKAESEGAASGESSLTYDNTSTFKNVDEQTELVPSVELLDAPPKPGTIAEREHAKWLNAVPLPNNPYSVENLSRRASESRRDSLTTAKTGSSFDTPLEDDNDEDGFCSPVLPSSYLRDYYINNPKLVAQVEASATRRSSLQSAKSLTSSGDPEETLHSFEEQVYSSPRKAFRPTAHVRTLTAAVSTPHLNIEDTTSIFPDKKVILEEKALNGQGNPIQKERHVAAKNQDAWSIKKDSDEPSIRPQPLPRKSLVHSLTARSLPREFREHAQRNLVPRQMNRTVVTSPASPPASGNLSEQVFQPQPLQVPAANNSSNNNNVSATAAGDVTPGYASDESSTSSSVGGGSGVPRHPSSSKRRPRVAASRGILQRSSYWDRRVEQGLLSDSSVTEEFPPLHEGHPDKTTKS